MTISRMCQILTIRQTRLSCPFARLTFDECVCCSLRVTGYPYCALLAFSGTRTQLTAAVEGCPGAARLLGVLQQAVSDHGGHLAVEQADANERVRTLPVSSLCTAQLRDAS